MTELAALGQFPAVRALVDSAGNDARICTWQNRDERAV
jgi:hypothetical protein